MTARPKPRVNPRERSFVRGLLFGINVVATLSLAAILTLLYLMPDRLAQYQMNAQMAQMVTLQIVSLLLLVAWLQRNLSATWRAFTLGAAFVVLAESWLVALT